jgi:hypothetical protein
VAPEHRTGAVISMVWAAIVHYLLLTGHRWLVGCASASLVDGGAVASEVWRQGRVSCRRQRLAEPGKPGQPSTVGGDRALIEAGEVAPSPPGRVCEQRPDVRSGKQGHGRGLAARRTLRPHVVSEAWTGRPRVPQAAGGA